MRIPAFILLGFTLLLTVFLTFSIVLMSSKLIGNGFPINSLITGKYPEEFNKFPRIHTVGEGSDFNGVSALIQLGIPFVIILWVFSIFALKKSKVKER